MWTVRQARPSDEAQIRQLIGRAERVIMHVRAADLADYLTEEPFLLAEEAGRLGGFLACFMRWPPRATLTAAGLADDWRIAPWLDHLLPPCVSSVRTQGAISLSYVGSANWLVTPLQARGFHLVSHIVAYEKRNWIVPDEGNQRVQVRPVRQADFPAIVTLDRLVFHPLWRNSAETLRWRQETRPYFVVASKERELAGYCYCSTEGEHGHLIRMAVHPAWQERGVGTRLVAEAMRFFRQAGVQLITLNTQEENERAQRLYCKFGFRPMGREAVALWMDLAQ